MRPADVRSIQGRRREKRAKMFATCRVPKRKWTRVWFGCHFWRAFYLPGQVERNLKIYRSWNAILRWILSISKLCFDVDHHESTLYSIKYEIPRKSKLIFHSRLRRHWVLYLHTSRDRPPDNGDDQIFAKARHTNKTIMLDTFICIDTHCDQLKSC